MSKPIVKQKAFLSQTPNAHRYIRKLQGVTSGNLPYYYYTIKSITGFKQHMAASFTIF
jgi:hypothetical protein